MTGRIRYAIDTLRDATEEPIVAVFSLLLIAVAALAGFFLGQWLGEDGTATVTVSRTATREVTNEVTQTVEVGIFEQKVRALPSEGRAGRPVELSWLSGRNARTRERIEIYRRGRVIDVIQTPVAPTEAGVRYSVKWRPRRSETGRLRFCVRSSDAAGGEPRVSCAPVLVQDGNA